MTKGTRLLIKILAGIIGLFLALNLLGYIAYGGATLGVKVMICSVIFMVFYAFTIKKSKEEPLPVPTAHNNTDHGSADWATQDEFNIANHGAKEPRHDGLWLSAGFTRTKQGHLLTIAGTGQGKGTCLIIPNLLIRPSGSYVITDPKGENACITARAQKEHGQHVYIIDPWEEQKKIGTTHGIASSGFNPFDFIKMDMDELRDNCEAIANFLVPDKSDTKDPYWNDRARSLIKTLLMHIVTAHPKEEHNFWTLYKMVRYADDDWANLLFEMKENKAMDELVSIAAQEFIGLEKSSNTIAGIRSTAQNATAIFESPQLRRSLSKSDFNPYSLANGNVTAYVVIPERFLDTHGTWLRLVIGLCLKACNAKPKHRVHFLLDEFPTMGKMKDIQRGYAFARGQNVILWAFAQSLSQLKEIYGENGMNTFISNSAVFQAFGVKDEFTQEYVSKLLGDATRMKASDQYGNSSAGSSSSISYQSFGRRLMTPEEVGKEPGIITIAEGEKARIKKLPYYKKPQPTNIGNKNQQKSKEDEILEFFVKQADAPPRIYA